MLGWETDQQQPSTEMTLREAADLQRKRMDALAEHQRKRNRAEDTVAFTLKREAADAIDDGVDPDAIIGALMLCHDMLRAVRRADEATISQCRERFAKERR